MKFWENLIASFPLIIHRLNNLGVSGIKDIYRHTGNMAIS
jgi:hypothetical protein